MARILVVCTGNICRSPMAEVLLRHRLKQDGLEDWQIESAGTWTVDGAPASRNAISVMGEQELNLFAHSSQRVEGRLMEWADLVLVMTENHAEILRLEFPEHVSKVFLLSEMKDGRRYDVSDPYGRSLAEYESCANLIKKLINDGWDRIRFLAERSAEGRKGA